MEGKSLQRNWDVFYSEASEKSMKTQPVCAAAFYPSVDNQYDCVQVSGGKNRRTKITR